MSDQLLSREIIAHASRIVALQLWNIGAIKVNPLKPFLLASGNYSPLYVNCRALISFPSFIDIYSASARLICERSSVRFDTIAGGETAGIPFAAFLARSLGCPMIYVRKKPKPHGLDLRVEGVITPGARVLLVEDLITDAASKTSFIDATRNAGGIVEDVLVVFDRLQGGQQALLAVGVRLHALTDIDMALLVAEEAKLLPSDTITEVRDYLRSPRLWHDRRGLQFRLASD